MTTLEFDTNDQLRLNKGTIYEQLKICIHTYISVITL